MPILQFKCESCAAVLEYYLSPRRELELDCMTCGSDMLSRVQATYFYPNKNFCPHDKDLDADLLKTQLGGIISNREQQCGGCGTDGAPGNCDTKSGSCGNCSCGKGGCGKSEMKVEIDGVLK